MHLQDWHLRLFQRLHQRLDRPSHLQECHNPRRFDRDPLRDIVGGCSGAGGPGATVLVVVDSVVVDVDVDVDAGVAAFSLLPPHDDDTTTNEINRPATAREERIRM